MGLFTEQSQQGFGRWVIWLRHGPSWPVRGALICGFVAMAIPLIVLALVGLVVGFAAYAVLSVIAWLGELFAPARNDSQGDTSGRSNVRVID